ncbi:MAG: iron-containing alcohol dehydrogenase [Clostridia bacterium]|nr:iron-containing alcohol dehydrogenase [Clostridia bacterium]
MYRLYCRVYQNVFKMVSYLLPFRKPILIEGQGSLSKLPDVVSSNGIQTVIIVTDRVIVSLGLVDSLLEGLKNKGIQYVIYDGTVPNPTIDNIEEALELYKLNQCKGIIAFGGGSSMDCAKGVAARLARPNKTIPQLKGVLKVIKAIPPLYAVPTTSGTGSEATIAAVITNSKTHEKYAINDTALIPHYAVLDPNLTLALPQHITSTTGMDALTHAVEAYIGKSNTSETKKMSKDAVKLILDNIFEAYSNGTNIIARENMQKASYYAGVAFTRAYVGNVHAIAHTLGGFYNTPHGLANAVILPYVLKSYGSSAHQKLSELEDLITVPSHQEDIETKANRFIDRLISLNRIMNIPDKISGIDEKDISIMVDRAHHEANPLYPVPKIFTREDFKTIYYEIKE